MCLIGPDSGTGRNQSLMHLKEVVCHDMPLLERWIVEPNCHLFPVLETIKCKDCPNLLSLPFFPVCFVSCARDTHCPSLRILEIDECPKLFVSPMPPAPALTSFKLLDTRRHLGFREEDNAFVLRGYSGAIAFQNIGNMESLLCFDGSITSWTDLQKVTSPMELTSSQYSGIKSISFFNCEILTADGFDPLITALNLKDLFVVNDKNHPRSIAVDLLSEVARRTKQLHAGSFQLEKLAVDSISAVLVAPVCSLLSATLHTLTISRDQRVESLTEEEEQALQLLTSLQTLEFLNCQGLPSLPQGLHSLSSLRVLEVLHCFEIRPLPTGGLPTALQKIWVYECSTELHEHVKKLKGTNPELEVDA